METLRSWPGAHGEVASLKTGCPWPWAEPPWGGRSWAGERGATRALNLRERKIEGEGEKEEVKAKGSLIDGNNASLR